MMRTNYEVHASPQFELLSWDQREEVYLAAPTALPRTAIMVYGDEALDLLGREGAQLGGDTGLLPSLGRTKRGPSGAAGHWAIGPTRR
jgi:trimethylamine:corrinoid methyltransferase-like protein